MISPRELKAPVQHSHQHSDNRLAQLLGLLELLMPLLRDGESPRASGYLRPLVRDLQSDNRGLLSDNHQLSASLQASGSHLPWARVLPLANLQLLAADLPRLESQHLASRDSRKLEVLRLRSANLPLVSPPLQ
jgi:hypothetical protein